VNDICQRLRAGHQYSGIVDPIDIEAAAKIEAEAKVIATLRERMTQIRAFVIVMNENNWRDIGDRIARQAAEYEQTVGSDK